MDWWETALLYLGVWLLGFCSGLNVGTARTLGKLTSLARRQPPGTPPVDASTLAALRAAKAQGGKQ